MQKALFIIILAVAIMQCDPAEKNDDNNSEENERIAIEAGTKKLLQEFLINENIDEVGSLLSDSLVFYWPNKMTNNKEELLKVCQGLVDHNENKVDLIDLVIEGNTAFVLFVWTATIEDNPNPNLLGKTFSVHDCYRLQWEDGKIKEWYTIWGSQDRLQQLGYEIIEPSDS